MFIMGFNDYGNDLIGFCCICIIFAHRWIISDLVFFAFRRVCGTNVDRTRQKTEIPVGLIYRPHQTNGTVGGEHGETFHVK